MPAAAAASAAASLTEDAYRHIISLCGVQTVGLRAVSRLFGHLWSDPATWAGSTAWSPPHGHASLPWCRFLCQRILPALARAAALDTSALALQLSSGPDGPGPHSFVAGQAVRAVTGAFVLSQAKVADVLSQARFEAMPAVNSNRPPARGWFQPAGGFRGVSSNVAISGSTARRAQPEALLGMAAVCADGPVARATSGERAYTLRVEGVSAFQAAGGCWGGIFAGFVATPPGSIDFSDMMAMWGSACMWRLVGDQLNANVPGYCASAPDAPAHVERATAMERATCLRHSGSFRQQPGVLPWATDELQLGDELRVIAQCGGGGPGEMCISATLNGRPVVLPTRMVRCSFAMELWPYVAVCGRVTAVRLVLSS